MEFKVIIYIILGIVYFLYSVGKKVQESKKEKSSTSNEPELNPKPEYKPVSPPVANPLDEIMREIKRKQAEQDAQKAKTIVTQKQVTKTQPKAQPKEMLVHQKQKGVFAEGNYERDLTDEEKIERGKLKIENEGIYKIKSVEETEVEESESAFKLDIRNAIIGQVILERKF
ncbi:MAG TPA: hypothetical protein VK154_07910 [Chitinophagales bacterium]|nr:hypothetical protein [Chitinophagales bacterium]